MTVVISSPSLKRHHQVQIYNHSLYDQIPAKLCTLPSALAVDHHVIIAAVSMLACIPSFQPQVFITAYRLAPWFNFDLGCLLQLFVQ